MKRCVRKGDGALEHRTLQVHRTRKDEAFEAFLVLDVLIRKVGGSHIEPELCLLIARLAEPIERKDPGLLKLRLRFQDLLSPLVPCLASHIAERARLMLVHMAPRSLPFASSRFNQSHACDNGHDEANTAFLGAAVKVEDFARVLLK